MVKPNNAHEKPNNFRNNIFGNRKYDTIGPHQQKPGTKINDPVAIFQLLLIIACEKPIIFKSTILVI